MPFQESRERLDTDSIGASSVNVAEEGLHNTSINSVITDYDFGDWLDGAELGSRISPARRFFCLFVTFDTLLCTILWLVCIVLSGKNLLAEAEEQIVHYSPKTSLFDVVAASFIRFMLLLIVYAAIKANHWCIIALTVAASSIGCLVKILYFTWHSSSTGSTFQATLIIAFFILGWLEVWLLDSKVIPQERRAQLVFQRRYGLPPARSAFMGHISNQHIRDYLSTCTGSVANFYSPMGSPPDSDDEDHSATLGSQGLVHLTDHQLKLRVQAEENCRHALDILNSTDWNEESQLGEADFLYSRRDSILTQFMFTCSINCAADIFANELIFNCDNCPEWNKAMHTCRQLERVDQQCEVRYQQTTALLKGTVSPRSFISLRLKGQKGLMFFSASVSIDHSNAPDDSQTVRGNTFPTIITVRPCVRRPSHCIVEWLINTDCKPGMIPKRLVDRGTCQAARVLYSDLQQLGRNLASKSH